MKKLYTLLTAVILTVSAMAQAPEKMSYQAVVRDASNALVTSQSVGMQISILQGSVSGIVVYVETQTPTTNINGLVSIEIGSGTVVSGTFNTIDWSNGPYFIKTETDPTGGTTYTITGASQLMSVPYALHANTADSIVGGLSITETDPVFGASVANGIAALDTANWNNHTVDTDNQLDSTDIANMGFVTGSATCGLSIGDTNAGGIIFYLDGTGCHGLVAKATDEPGFPRWPLTALTGGFHTWAFASGIYGGAQNTKKSIAIALVNTSTSQAASITSQPFGGYDDWYLPSKDELDMMYVNLHLQGLGGLNSNIYWSSTEVNAIIAWGQDFGNGSQLGEHKILPGSVRAVRAF